MTEEQEREYEEKVQLFNESHLRFVSARDRCESLIVLWNAQTDRKIRYTIIMFVLMVCGILSHLWLGTSDGDLIRHNCIMWVICFLLVLDWGKFRRTSKESLIEMNEYARQLITLRQEIESMCEDEQ